MEGQVRQARKGQRIVIDPRARGPIMVHAGDKGARYRFRGVVHTMQPAQCFTYAKLNKAAEAIEVLQGDVEVQG